MLPSLTTFLQIHAVRKFVTLLSLYTAFFVNFKKIADKNITVCFQLQQLCLNGIFNAFNNA